MASAPLSREIGLVVSDIDGTLVRGDKSLSAAVIGAILRLCASGIQVSLISARPPSGMVWLAERLGLDAPLGAFNGGTITDARGVIITADRLAAEDAARTLALLDQPGITPWLFADGAWYARETLGAHVPSERRAANVQPILVGDFATLLASVDKIVGVSEDHALLAGLENEAATALGDRATVARSQPYYLDVTAARANKGDGVAAIAEAVGVSLTRVAVLGDQRNDLAMFARAGFSIAMGQGPQEVRDAADEVTLSNDEDGVAAAIDRYLLKAADGETA